MAGVPGRCRVHRQHQVGLRVECITKGVSRSLVFRCAHLSVRLRNEAAVSRELARRLAGAGEQVLGGAPHADTFHQFTPSRVFAVLSHILHP